MIKLCLPFTLLKAAVSFGAQAAPVFLSLDADALLTGEL